MVDFQSRDTKFVETDDEDEDAEENEKEGDSSTGDDGHDDQADDHGHDHHVHDKEDLGVAVLTISSSRSLDDDPSGDEIARQFESAGHTVVTRDMVRDSRDDIQSTVDALAGREDVDVVVSTGGTGVSPDDVTVEAVTPLFEKDLPGFGELFRSLSFEDVGTRVVGTRATAGVAEGVPVFSLPGSESAVALAVGDIVLPEIGHLAGLATRGRDEDEE